MTCNLRSRPWGVLALLSYFVYFSSIAYGQDLTSDELYAEIDLIFYNGDFGTNTDTDIYNTDLTLGYSPNELWEFSLTIPCLYQSTTSTVTIAGRPVRVKSNRTRGRGRITDQDIDTTSHSGLGDIRVSASYMALMETLNSPALYILSGIKFPSADEKKGLGTGEYDYFVGVGLERMISKWTVFGNAKYNIVGSPGGIDLDNFLSVTAGASHQVTMDFEGSVHIYAAESPSDESDSPLEIGFSGEYTLNMDNKASLYAIIGLSDGSPDYGIGVALTHYF